MRRLEERQSKLSKLLRSLSFKVDANPSLFEVADQEMKAGVKELCQNSRKGKAPGLKKLTLISRQNSMEQFEQTLKRNLEDMESRIEDRLSKIQSQ